MLTFPKALPEETGISSKYLVNFIARLQKRKVPMHSILLLHKDKLIFEGYYAPYKADTLHRMFSISKSFTSIAIGLLEAEGKLHLADPICNYFPEYVTADTHPWILAMTIEDMLMMRTCHASTTYKLNMESDWVESFFTVPPTHPSGKFFHYDTSSAHTLCALVEKLSGMDMLSYIKMKLAPLDLSDASYMIKDPFGVSLGGSGLVATPMDILKFGYLIYKGGTLSPSDLGSDNNGNYLQLIPSDYIARATANLTPTKVTAPLPSEACGYGYQFWQNEKGGYVCYGMGGQFIIFLPEYDMICVTTADTQGMAGGNQLIYDALYEEILAPLKQTSAGDALPAVTMQGTISAQRELEDLTEKLTLPALDGIYSSPFASCVSGKKYTLLEKKNDFSEISVEFADTTSAHQHSAGSTSSTYSYGRLNFTLHDQECSLDFGFGSLKCGIFPIYNMKYAASAEWLSEDTLYIKVQIIDSYVGSVHFELTFGENDVTVFLKKVEESLFSEFNGHLYGSWVN